MKYEKIKNIASIQTGLVLARKGAKQLELIKQDMAEQVSLLKPIEYKALTLRAITNYADSGNLHVNDLDVFQSIEQMSDRYLTHENNIIIRLFTPMSSFLITEEYKNIVVPSQFGIIKVTSMDFLPEYLHMCLTQKSIIHQLGQHEEGLHLRSIKTSTVGEVEIPILPLVQQQKLIEINSLLKYKENLIKELYEQEKLYNEAIIRNLLQNKMEI